MILRPSLSAVLAVFAANAVAAIDFPVKVRMETAAAWVENLGNVSAVADRREAARFHAGVAATHLREWPHAIVTTVELNAASEHVPDFTRADVVTLGARLGARYKFGLGAFAPVLDASVSPTQHAARLSAADGWTLAGALRLSQRLTPAWRVAATFDGRQHFAKSAAFDTHDHRFFGQLSWDLTPRWQLSYGAGRLWGTLTANASPDVWARALSGELGASVSTYYNTVPWLPTGVYGPDWVSYRVSARTNFQWFEIAPALGRNTSLPLRYERFSSTNIIGVKYPKEIWSLGLLHRF